jgi:hypothetical protein
VQIGGLQTVNRQGTLRKSGTKSAHAVHGWFALLLMASPAVAADTITCSLYSDNVERWVAYATNDPDVAMAARTTSEAWCTVLDEPPINFTTETPIANSKPATPDPSVKRCKKAYASYREEDGTVIKRGAKARTPCPL